MAVARSVPGRMISKHALMNQILRVMLASAVIIPQTTVALSAEPRLESNVIYGMYSGLALLADIFHPDQPNGYGIIFVSGSGWHDPTGYDARPLKDRGQEQAYAVPLAKAGYTVFVLNHRAAPRFRYPAAVEDVQRAVRFIRHSAGRFGIRADRIGAMGGSSGGHLVSLLGTLDGAGDPDDPDPVNRESAKVQCVVARAAPSDMSAMAGSDGAPHVASFLGAPFPDNPTSEEGRRYREASPVSHVSREDAPFLLLHGDRDKVVPFEQAERMLAALKKAGVAAELLRIPGGEHGPVFGQVKNPPDYIGTMIEWFNLHLKGKG